jgi:predicted glycosyltransferase involved in capsule biosynthesis
MAFWRDDLVKVNGYNEAFIGWGREDNEIGLRLIHSGLRKRIVMD